jgi:hypothetical protein
MNNNNKAKEADEAIAPFLEDCAEVRIAHLTVKLRLE